MEVSGVYRVNHHHYLSEKLSTQLEKIRAVMVDKVTKTTVSVSYPSEKSMENFFRGNVADKIPPTTGLMQPNLDRSCVMTPDLARKVLRDRISFEEFASRRGERSFWMVSVENANTDSASGKRMKDGEVVVRGGCVKKDNSNVLAAEWGARKRSSFTGKQRSDMGSSTVMMSGSSRMQVSFCGGDVEKLGMEKWEEEVEDKVDEGRSKVERKMSRKRKKPCETGKLKQQQIVKKKKKKTMKKQKAPVEINNSTDCNNYEDPKLRWSEQRYKLAERNILKIMKEKGAVYGNPVVRAELRTEARKMIGDTGLLDHLLKHMAGKLAPGGKERFRRRHNPDGIMEYWIESAELVDIRKQAGVEDPYWTPPKGWVKGDPITMDAGCAAEIKRLRDDMEKLKREFVEVARAEGGRRKEMVAREERGLDHHGAKNLKAKQEELLRRKAAIEEQLHNVSKALDEMQEDVDTLMREAAEAKSNKSSRISNNSTRVVVVAATSAGVINEPDDHNGYCGTEAGEIKEDDTEKTKAQAAGDRPKSAFRICKPAGAFLWPGDMAAGAAATLSAVPPSSSTSSQVVIQVVPEDVLFASSSSPLSVSSSTSSTMGPAPLLQSAPPPLAPAGVIKPVAKRAAVIMEKEEAGCNAKNGNGTSPTATASSVNRTAVSVNRTAVPDYVPDLNEIPLDAYLQPYQNVTRSSGSFGFMQRATPPSPPVAVPNYSTYTTVPTSLSQSAGGWSFLPPLASPSSSVPSIIRRRLQHSGNQMVLTIKPPSSSAEHNTFMFPVPN